LRAVDSTRLPHFVKKQWDFGTLQFDRLTPTGCTAAGLAQYQVQIPVNEIFWDPPVVGGVANLLAYVAAAPAGVVGPFVTIDLFHIQQIALKWQ
jgi:hypothetical protein